LAVRINDAGNDIVVHSFAGDDPLDCKDYVRAKLGMPQWQPGDGREHQRTIDPAHISSWDFAACDAEVAARPRSEEDAERILRAQRLWNEAGDPRGTAAEQYLAARALALPDDLCGNVLRYHERTPWRDEDIGQTIFAPCLLACFRSIDDDTITAVHRIRVDRPQLWPKTQRRMLGVVSRAAVKLAPARGELLVAEGLETAMSPREAGLTVPCWALGSAGAISRFPVIGGVNKLMLAAEMSKDDLTKPNWASDRSIYCCRLRWHRAGRKTVVLKPTVGDDLNATLIHMKTTGAAG
jgi:hypothetical protein